MIWEHTMQPTMLLGDEATKTLKEKEREKKERESKLKSDRDAPVSVIAFGGSPLSGVTWMAETPERKI
jgi:hypothetical protein